MSDPLTRLPDLAPPPGGLPRLQRAMRRRSPPLRGSWRLPVAAAVLAAAMLLALVPSLHRLMQVDADARAIRNLLRTPASGQMQVRDGVAAPLESGRADVQLYLIGALPAAAPPPPG